MPEFTPDAIAQQSFRTVFRGYDPTEVRGFLTGLSDALNALVEERDRLVAKLGTADPDELRREIEVVSREIGVVLESARAAADTMRERAAAEAARWRSESVAEAEKLRREAAADAEHLRTDAWTTSEALLNDVQRHADTLRAQAEKETLRLVGEAEREAHRMVGSGRREAEESVRTARMTAEKLVLDAQVEHDEIIVRAQQQAEIAQERTRALEERRDELRHELESVRSALSSVEMELDERREALGLTPSQVAPPPEQDKEDWSPGETVRLVRPGQPSPRGEDEPVSVDPPGGAPETTPEMRVLSKEEMRALQSPSAPEIDQTDELLADDESPAATEELEPASAPAADTEEVTADDDEPPATTDGAAEDPEHADTGDDEAADELAADEAADDGATTGGVEPDVDDGPEPSSIDELEGLFARLREPAPAGPPDGAAAATTSRLVATVDPFEVRDRLLLPIANRALRNLKRQLTDEQNGALEEIRLDPEDWEPDPDALRASLRADLVVLAAESFAAGHAAAETLVGDRLTRPPTPDFDLASAFAAALAEDVGKALDDGRVKEHGARQLGADVSRVFRAWRTDESERRLTDQSRAAFNRGVAGTLEAAGIDQLRWHVAGRGCARCRERAASERLSEVSLVHDGCGCTVLPA